MFLLSNWIEKLLFIWNMIEINIMQGVIYTEKIVEIVNEFSALINNRIFLTIIDFNFNLLNC